MIGGVGTVAYVGAHLPPIQSLEIPKRPPSIQIVDDDGRVLAVRGDAGGAVLSLQGAAELSAESLRRHRGSPLLRALRRRSLRHRPRAACQHLAQRYQPGRLHHHAATGEESLFNSRTYAHAQAAGGAAGVVAGAQILQGADSRALFESRVFRRRRLRHRAGRAALFRQVGAAGLRCRSRDARRPRQIADAAGADAQFRRRRGARQGRARRHGRTGLHQLRQTRNWRWRIRRASPRSRAPARSITSPTG